MRASIFKIVAILPIMIGISYFCSPSPVAKSAEVTEDRVMDCSVPWKNEPRARQCTDYFYMEDFTLDQTNLLSRYFTGGNPTLFEGFKMEFCIGGYVHTLPKPETEDQHEEYNCTVHT